MLVLRLIKAIAAVALLAGAPSPASAQSDTWPSKPIKFIVPFAPGGGADVVARLVGAKLADALGQPVVVENRAGASGNIGAAVAARAPADGYTIVFAYSGTHAINPDVVSGPGIQEQRLRARRAHDERSAGDDAQHGGSRGQRQGAHRARQVQARATQLRVERRVQSARRGAVQRNGRHQRRAHSVYRRRGVDDRPTRRRRRLSVHGSAGGAAVREGGAAARDCRDLGEALGPLPRPADGGRSGVAGL